jgi:hypothetical protein
LLEQEAASVQLFTDEGRSTRVRIVDGKEWKILVSTEGTQFVRYTLTASKNCRKLGEVVVYGISSK